MSLKIRAAGRILNTALRLYRAALTQACVKQHKIAQRHHDAADGHDAYVLHVMRANKELREKAQVQRTRADDLWINTTKKLNALPKEVQ